MSTITYRLMEPEDVPAVLEVRFSTIENAITLEELQADYGITPESMAESLRSGDVIGWVCENSGQAVGFSMGDRANGEVQVLAVRPGFEQLGIGRALLAKVCQWLFQQHWDEIWLYSNPDQSNRAYGFYRALGWRYTDLEDGEEVLKLRASDFTPWSSFAGA